MVIKSTSTKKKKSSIKKPTISVMKKKVWDQFSVYIRLRDSLATTGTVEFLRCITCDKRIKTFGAGAAQAGHFIPGRNNALLFDEEQVNGQCFQCNIWDHGKWPEYYEVMLKRHGQEKVDIMLGRRHNIRRFTINELELMFEDYKKRIVNLRPQ